MLMTTNKLDNITLCELSDEPVLSEELCALITHLEQPKARSSHVVLNFSDVTYVNSSNLGQLIKLRKLLEQHDRSLVLCAISDEVVEVIRITGLERLFRIAANPMTALTALQLEAEAAG